MAGKRRPGPYFVVAQGYHHHPKVLAAGPAGRAFHLAALDYTTTNQTDGVLPRPAVPTVHHMAGTRAPALAAALDAGLIDPLPDTSDLLVHDFADWQRLASDIEETGQKRALAGRSGGEATRKQVAARLLTQSVPTRGSKNAATRASAETEAEAEREAEVNPGLSLSRNAVNPPPPPRRGKSADADAVEGFLRVWDENRGSLPAIIAPPKMERVKLIRQAVGSGSLDAIGKAVALCATDPHYVGGGHGVEAFCRHVDRWLELSAAGRTSMAGTVAAPKPLPENPIDRRIRESRMAMAGGMSS